MCGIAGIISPDPGQLSADRLRTMTDAIAHRGPDGQACWISPSGLIGLGHRRLSIIDLSDAAAQPMHYLGRYSIVHNGEIYNYKELRSGLVAKGYTFSSRSDTEVILAAYDHYGPDCLRLFDGMFAFAIWDETKKQLFLARDRFGEKPLFFCRDGSRFLFASEMKALWAVGVPRDINKRMVFNFITLGYTQNPGNGAETFYNGISKLPARSMLVYDVAGEDGGRAPGGGGRTAGGNGGGALGGGGRTAGGNGGAGLGGEMKISCYWDIRPEDAGERWEADGPGSQGPANDQDAIQRFTDLFSTSISRRLRSDVPLGCSLSGGLDSSSVAAAICRQLEGHKKLSSFSAVFPGFEKDESSYIRLFGGHFAVDDHEVTPRAVELVGDLEKLIRHQEEPFLSSGIYAQFRVFGLAAEQKVKVLLDGQGADELLAGYHKYYHWYWQELYRRDKVAFALELEAARQSGIEERWSWRNKLAANLPVYAGLFLKRRRTAQQRRNKDLTGEFIRHFGVSYYDIPHVDRLSGVLYYNSFMNGLEELLRYADRNSMAHGVEVRLPFLNHELVEFLFSLPSHFKIREGWTKWLLRVSMEGVLPPEIVWRKDKTGYETPQRSWMEEPVLQDYIHEARKALVDQQILKPGILHKKIQPQEVHAAENQDWRYLVTAACLKKD